MVSERKIKRQRRKKRRIIIAVCVVLVCILSYLIVNSQFVKGLYYKMGNPVSDDNPVRELESNLNAQYTVFDNLIVSSSKNGIFAYDIKTESVKTKHFEEISSVVSGYGELKLKQCDKYILAYNKGGRDVLVFNGGKIICNVKTTFSIIQAKPLNNGGFVVIAEDMSAKNQVVVFNSNGKEEFIWHSGVNNIIDASYSYETNKLAVVTADLSTGILNSKLILFDISSATPYSEMTFDDTFITNINYFSKNTMLALSDKGIYYVDNDGSIKNEYSFNEKMLNKYSLMNNGYIALSYKSTTGNTVNEIINNKGKLIGTYLSDNEILYIDSFNGNILLCEKRAVNIITKRGFLLRRTEYSKDLNKALFMGRNKIVLIGNSELRIIN